MSKNNIYISLCSYNFFSRPWRAVWRLRWEALPSLSLSPWHLVLTLFKADIRQGEQETEGQEGVGEHGQIHLQPLAGHQLPKQPQVQKDSENNPNLRSTSRCFAGPRKWTVGLFLTLTRSPCLLIGSAPRNFQKQCLGMNLKDNAEKMKSAVKENSL